MKEYNILEEKKKLAQFITPQELRDFIKKEVGAVESVFDCSVGSGQLIYGIESPIKDGTDIDSNAVKYAIENGINARCEDFILSENNKKYDVVVSNYPFSLRATEEQKEAIKNTHIDILKNVKGFTGVLDFVFIIKSFLMAEKGYYLCSPGIGYRTQEKKYRQWLIENEYLEKIVMINNAGFKDTQIPILYLKLSKGNKEVVVEEIDLKTNIKEGAVVSNDLIKSNDYTFTVNSYIPRDNKKEEVNISDIEDSTTKSFSSFIKNQLELDLFLLKNNMLKKQTIIEKIECLKEYYEYYKKEVTDER